MTQSEMQKVVAEIARRISERFHPEKVILFGSLAEGTGSGDSDADLLVVMNVSGSKRKQAVAIDLALQGIPIPTDVLVVTPEEIEKYQDLSGTIIQEAMHKGKTIYERDA